MLVSKITMDKALLQKITGAVENGNARLLNSLLECKQNVSIEPVLFPSPGYACGLLAAWELQVELELSKVSEASEGSGEDEESLTFSTVQRFQALLFIRPCYVTPWMALAEFATKCLRMPLETVCLCVSAVEVFLREASSLTGDQAGPVSECDDFILQAAEEAINNLMDESRLCPNDRMSLLCDFILSLFEFSNKRSSGEMRTKLRHLVFRQTLSSTTIHIWIKLVHRLISVATPNDLDATRDSTLKYLKRHGTEISVGALKDILDISMEIATFEVDGKEKNAVHTYSSWYQVPIQLLVATKSRREDYASLDNHLSTVLAGLTRAEFAGFGEVFDRETGGPEWIRLNVVFIICQCEQNSTSSMVLDLFSLGGEKEVSSKNAVLDCQASLLDILFPKKETFAQLDLTGIFEKDKSLLVEVLGDVTYGGVGVFIDDDDAKIVSLSRAAKLLLNIVSTGNPFGHKSDAYCRRRSLDIVRLVESFIFSGKAIADARTILFFIVATTVLYNKSPGCRGLVGDILRRGLLWKGVDPMQKIICIAAVALIFGSRHDADLDKQFLEPCITLFRQPLDAETFMQLASCISRCKLARSMVLSSSRALLNRSYSSAWEESDESETSSDDMVRAGLFGLLELLRSSIWDEISLKSWNTLSNCLVMDTPPLKMSERTWFYGQIADLLQHEELDESTGKHFLRATIARLAKFVLKESAEHSERFVAENAFIVWEDATVGLTQTRQTEDLVGLLRLSLSLLFQNSSKKIEASPLPQRENIQDLLIQRVLCYKHRTERDDRRVRCETLKGCFDDSHNDEFMVHFSTLITYFAAVFDYLIQMGTSQTDLDDVPPQGEGLAILERGLSYVVEQEREAFDSESTRLSDEGTEPLWLTVGTDTLMSSREVDVGPASMALIHSSLCELLVEVLFGHTLQNIRGRERSVDLCRRILRAAGCVLELKHNLDARAMNAATNDPAAPRMLPTSTSTIASTGTEFFSAASRVVQYIVSHNLPLDEAEQQLTSIILFCQAVHNCSGNTETGVGLLLLRSLWALYQMVGSEKGASRFVSYLESNMTTEAAVSKSDKSVCSLKSIRSVDDVDNAIRNIRVPVLNALESCLQFATASGQETIEARLVSGASSVETSALNEAVDSESSYVASIFSAIAQDLKDGLEGQSGGITTEMYESYLSSLQACATLLCQFSMPTGIGVAPGIFSIFAKVVKSVREILRSFPLPDARLFRSSLITATAEFPSVMRGMLRDYLMTHPMDSLEMNKLFNPERTLVAGLFDDCIFILTRWASLRDPNSVPWEDIAGKLHADGIGDGGSLAPTHANDGIADKIEVNLRTKELWSWALSCIFLALEENWAESLRCIVYDIDRPERFIDAAAVDTMLTFFSRRQKDLHFTLERVATLFTSSTAAVESQAQPAVLDMLAMNLPSAPRLRFCHLVATISKVLKLSIDHLRVYFTAGPASTHKTQAKVCFLEALGALGAWLVLDDDKADFAVGIFRWLSILRRKRPPGEHPSKRIDTTDLVPWVEKASLLVRDLHTALKAFERVVSGSIDGDGLGPTLSVFFSGGLSDMVRLTKRKLRLLELVMPSEYTASSLPDFPFLSETNGVKKKRARRQISSRPKKRPATHMAKSRNHIVNAFMSLDRKNYSQDGAPSDAFVDLEDFLVEG